MKPTNLIKKYPPSEPCACQVCLSYCQRPGWWTVAQTGDIYRAGYSGRMMLEISPERKYAVLSLAFRGCERGFALQEFAEQGCNFLSPDQRCELYGSSFQPLECRFCHHDRPGLDPLCHADLEQEWQTSAGILLVRRWCKQVGLWDMLDAFGLEKLKNA